MTDENRERLKIALWLIIGALGDIVFMPIGLVINIGLIVWLLFKVFHKPAADGGFFSFAECRTLARTVAKAYRKQCGSRSGGRQ